MLADRPRHKRSICVSTLLEMGFPAARAADAADAAGCDISAAAALVSERGPFTISKPVSVTGWAQPGGMDSRALVPRRAAQG